MLTRKIHRSSTLIVCTAALLAACSPEAKRARIQQKAEGYRSAGDLDKARIEFLNLLREDPQNAKANLQLGLIWIEQGSAVQALPFLQRAKEATPNDFTARGRLALALRTVGQFAEARKEALEILAAEPLQEDALLVLADTSLNAGQIRAAEDELRKVEGRETPAVHLAWATLAGRKGDLAGAESAVRRALELDPKSANAHLTMANLRLAQKDSAQAAAEFKKAAELAPPRGIARLKYAEFLAQTGAKDEARKSLLALTGEVPDYLPAWVLLAQVALSDRDFPGALAHLQNVLSRDAMNFDARLLEGQILLAKGDAKKAVAGFEKLDAAYVGVPIIRYHLARAQLQEGNVTPAMMALNQALTASPDFAEAALLLGELNLRRGDGQATATAMLDLVRKQPHMLPAHLLLADAYRTLARLDDAASICRSLITAFPDKSQPHFLLGMVLRQQAKIPEARQAFGKAQELGHDPFLSAYQLVELDLQTKDFAAATKRVEGQIAQSPKSAGAHFLQARVYAAQREWDRAEAALVKTLELDPNFVSAYDLLVSTYVAAGKLSEAMGQLDGLVALNPNNERPLMLSALIHDRMNSHEKAGETYEKLLSQNPSFAPALNNLAWLYAEHLNQLDRAHELARKARALQPVDPSIADTLGWICYKRAEIPQAVALLQEAAGKLPGNHEVQFHYGQANYMMGQMDAARVALRFAAEAPEDFPGKSEIPGRLASLGDQSVGVGAPSVTQFEQMAKVDPADVVAQMRVAAYHEKERDFTKAAATYEAVLKVNPKLLPPTVKLAELFAGPLKEPARALDFAKKARALAPNDPKVTGLLGSIAQQSGNSEWAYGLLQESVRKLPEDPSIQHALGSAAYRLGKVVEARQVMERVAGLAAPDSPEALDAKAFLKMTALADDPARLAAAEAEIRKILDGNPASVPALMARAALETQQANAAAAAATYVEVLRLFPDFAPAQRHLAIHYANSESNRPAAYELAVKARKSLPNDPELAQALAELTYDRKDFAYARQLLRESEGRKALGARQLYYLGMASRQLKDKPLAEDALKRALAADLPEPMAAEARRVLAEQARE